MWEVIKKNKEKSIIALIVMLVWYTFIYGIICAIIIGYLHTLVFNLSYSFIDNIIANFIVSIFPNINFAQAQQIAVTLNCFGIGAIISILIFVFKFITAKSKPYTIASFNIYPADKIKNKQIYNIVEEIAIASGISKIPKIYILNSDIMNAYACGLNPDNSSIVISKALLEHLNRYELQGVIAHEMSHIINRDTTYLLCSGLLFIIASGFSSIFLSYFKGRGRKDGRVAIFMLILFLISILGQAICFVLFMFISRKREYLADACAALYTRYPKGLADALLKITNANINDNQNINHLIKASFTAPLKENNKKYEFLSTHPTTENRIKILLNMTSADYMAYEEEFKKLNHESLIPKSALLNSKKVEIKQIEPEKIIAPAVAIACSVQSEFKDNEIIKENKELLEKNIEKHRQIEDMVRSLAGYKVIKCDCETILKIPPCYNNKIVICPHCRKKHLINF